jgi:hypothetical protein
MSAFGNFEKDEVVEAIKALAKSELEKGKTPREIITSIMEATTYGIDSVMFELNQG